MNDEQIKFVEAVRAELGDYAKEAKDEDLLDETKVAELRKFKETAEQATAAQKTIQAEMKNISNEHFITTVTYKDDGTTEVNSEKECVYTWVDSDGVTQTETIKEKTDVFYMMSEKEKNEKESKIADLEAKVSEQEQALNEKAEVIKSFQDDQDARLQAEKDARLAEIKAELQDNPYTKDFSDEDYLNPDKIEMAKIRQENDELKAKVSITAAQENTDLDAGIPPIVKPKTISQVLQGKLQK